MLTMVYGKYELGLYGISVLVTTTVLNLNRYTVYIFCLVIRNIEY